MFALPIIQQYISEMQRRKIIMSKDKKTITINNKEYPVDSLSDVTKRLINQVQDLDTKIQKAKFNLMQLEGGREHFFDKLVKELE